MSNHEFRARYIFGASPREATLAMCLAIVSGTCLSALGTDSTQLGTVETAKVIANMTVPELLAAIALSSLGLAGYCVRSLLVQGREATRALTQIAARMEGMQCLGRARQQEALGE